MVIIEEMAILFGTCLLGEGISQLLPVPFPASVISMLLLLLALHFSIIQPKRIRLLSEFLLSNMAIFFIPAGVGLLEQYPLLQGNLLRLVLLCVVSTGITFLATVYATSFAIWATRRRKR